MRTFVALDIESSIRQQIERFVEGVRGFAPGVRWVKSESLHLTLKFIGEQSPESVEEIKKTLSQIRAGAFDVKFRGYGFFPTAKSARVFWVGIEAGPPLANLAATIDKATASLGIRGEDRAFSPHLTLARDGSGAPQRQKGDQINLRFQHLQQKLETYSSLDFGTMGARQFFLYESKLLRGGPQYTKIAEVALRTEN